MNINSSSFLKRNYLSNIISLLALLTLFQILFIETSVNAEYIVEYFRQCEPGKFVSTDSTVGDPEVILGTDINFEASDAPWQYTKPDGSTALFPYKDEYAASFKGSIDLTGMASGTYKFCLESDDGSKLWIDNVEVVEDVGLHSMLKKCGSISLDGSDGSTKIKYAFKLNYYEDRGWQGLKLSWATPGQTDDVPIPASNFIQPDSDDKGVRIELYRQCHKSANIADLHLDQKQPFTSPIIVTGVPINFNECPAGKYWCPKKGSAAQCKDSPDDPAGTESSPCMPFVDYYAARFTGHLSLIAKDEKPTECTFQLESDDGSVLHINGSVIVNNDGVHGMTKKTGKFTIPKSGLYPFRLEWFENEPPGGLIFSMKDCQTNEYDAMRFIDHTVFKLNAVDKDAANAPDRQCKELGPAKINEKQDAAATRQKIREQCIAENKFIWCDQVPFPTVVGDGRCDEENNLEGCWDGGDCCESTCKDSHYICSEGNKYETCHAGFLPGLEAEFHKDVAVAEEGILVETVVVPTIDWEWGAPNAKTWHGLNPNELVESWEKFALFIKGFIYISNAGRYDFCLRSDDGSSLYLDSKLDETVYNENYHAMKQICETQYMSPGFHPFYVRYYQGRQYCGLTMDVAGPTWLDQAKFGKARLRKEWLWYAKVCTDSTCSGHGTCEALNTEPAKFGVPYNHTCNCERGFYPGAGTCLVDIPTPIPPPGINGWEIVFFVFLGFAIIGCGLCVWKREQVKAFLIQKLASAKFYSKMQPLGIGGDDRLEMDHI